MEVKCGFCPSNREWYCKFNYGGRGMGRGARNPPVGRRCFRTSAEAYIFMRLLLRTNLPITILDIDSELNSLIQIRDGDELINVRHVRWNFIGGQNNGEKLESYNFLFSQINPLVLRTVEINTIDFDYNNPAQNADLFELERTSMNLEFFNFDGLINDEQLLGIRSNKGALWNCGLVTPPGFVRFIQRQLLQPPMTLQFTLHRFSNALRYYLFGESFEPDESYKIELLLNLPGSNLKLSIQFFLEGYIGDDDVSDEDDDLASAYIEIKLIGLVNVAEAAIHEVNSEALEVHPSLMNFINAISEELPRGFQLLCDMKVE